MPNPEKALGPAPDHGKSLGADLNELYEVAHYIASVTQDYTQAAKLVSSCKSPAVDQPWTGIVAEWPSLQSIVSNILGGTAKNLTDTATGLNQTANNYATTDHAAANEFHRLQQQDVSQPGW